MKNIFRRKKDHASVISPNAISPTASPIPSSQVAIDEYQSGYEDSIALSETVTLLNEKKTQTNHTDLQPTFDENFNQYLPFVVRRLRVEAHEQEKRVQRGSITDRKQPFGDRTNESTFEKNGGKGAEKGTNGFNEVNDDYSEFNDDHDEEETVVSRDTVPETGPLILNKPTSVYNYKRELVFVGELLKTASYIFPSPESFELFRDLRKGKPAKNSTLVYENDRKQFRRVLNSDLSILKNYTVDTNQHIISPEFKTSGLGMPLFKISTPYLSSFRKNAPFLILKKYREIPLLNTSPDSHGKEFDDHEDHETFNYCMVRSKYYHKVRRLLFEFKNEKGETTAKFLAFQNNFRSFTDFHYRGTRFRVIGTSTVASLAEYLPNLKLLRIDDGQPSLCDDIVNKKPGFGISTIMKKRGSVGESSKDSRRSSGGESTSRKGSVGDVEKEKDIANVTVTNGDRHGSIGSDYEFDELDEPEFPESESNNETSSKPLDPADYENPHPNPDNILLEEREFRYQSGSSSHIPNDLPPFATSRELSYYSGTSGSFLPKKFTENGKIEIYEDYSEGFPRDVNSTLAVDEDTLVLSCVMATLRETGLRNATRTRTTATARVGLGATNMGSFM